MIEILEFIFAGFWRWLGCMILISIIAGIPRGIINFTIKKVTKKVEAKVKERMNGYQAGRHTTEG